MHELQEQRKNSIKSIFIDMMLSVRCASEMIDVKEDLVEMLEDLTIEILEG